MFYLMYQVGELASSELHDRTFFHLEAADVTDAQTQICDYYFSEAVCADEPERAWSMESVVEMWTPMFESDSPIRVHNPAAEAYMDDRNVIDLVGR